MIFYGQETENEEKKQDASNIAMEKLLKSRTIVISGEINQALAEKVTTQLLVLEQMGDEPIKIFINSQGGHVESGDMAQALGIEKGKEAGLVAMDVEVEGNSYSDKTIEKEFDWKECI